MGLLGFLAAAPADTIDIVETIKTHNENAIRQLVTDPSGFFQDLLQQGIDFGLKLMAAIVIYLVGAWLIRRITKAMRRGFTKRNAEPTMASFSVSLVSITLTVLLIIITIGTLGVNTTSLAALLAGGGVAIGLALNGTVQNFAGGIMILMFKPFKVGDYIKTGSHEGFVTSLSIVNTKIRTYDGTVIILPNGSLYSGEIVNVTEKPVLRCSWVVNVAYGSDSDKVLKVLDAVMAAEPRLAGKETEGASDPSSAVTALNEKSIEFTARAWTKTADYWDVLYKINKDIYDELPKNGIEFAYPQRLDVRLDK